MPPIKTITILCALLLFAGCISAQTPDLDSAAVRQLLTTAKKMYKAGSISEGLDVSHDAHQRSLARFGTDNIITAHAGMHVAKGYRELNRENEALPFAEQSLVIYHRLGDIFWEASCHNEMVVCKRKMMRYAEAHDHARKAYALLLSDSAKYVSLIAGVNQNEASVYLSEKRYAEALSLLQQARYAGESLNDKEFLGTVHFHLGTAYFELNDFSRAREHYLTSLSFLRNRLSPTHSWFADLYERISRCFQKTGDSETGLKYLLKARDIYVANGTSNNNYVAFLQYFGQFYFAEEQYGEAMQQFEACLEAKETLYGKHSRYLLKTLYSMGETGIALARYDTAELYLQRGMQILRDSFHGNGQLLFPFVAQCAVLEMARNHPSESIALCDSAFALAGFNPGDPETAFPRNQVRTLCTTYARAHMSFFAASGDVLALQTADHYYGLASRLLFHDIDEISEESSREIFYDKGHEVLDDWLDARMALYRVTGKSEHALSAFVVAGQERAFLLSDAMRRSGALRYSGVPDSTLQQERLLRDNIAEAEKKLVENNYQAKKQIDSAALILNRELTDVRDNYDALMRRIERQYPAYFQLGKAPMVASVDVLQKETLEPDQAMLMYSPTKTAVYAFFLTRDTFVALQLPPAPEVEAFNHSLTSFFTDPDSHDALYDRNLEQYTALAQTLYRDLVGPLEALLPDRLIIVPGDELCNLPFEALLTGKPEAPGNWKTYPFWARQKAIRYAFSPELAMQKQPADGRNAPKPWLGIAPFSTGMPADGLEVRNAPDETFAPLPFSGEEVRTIASHMHGDVWLDTTSGAGRFRREASAYRILHLATHSRADDRQGDYSYLVLSSSGERLPARDLYQYDLSADMVVLSSCEAGGGKLINGEGIIGLVRAFTYAGAKSVVASQWVTGDQSSAELMIAFYKFLLQGMPRDQALQAARLYLMNNHPDQGHPFYWAGFRLYGG